jgi:nucleoside 2-deoxyribosyltransferase
MFKVYIAQAIDSNPEGVIENINNFANILIEYGLDVRGAGIPPSPIIGPDTNIERKKVIVAYDLTVLRGCDILLVISDLDTFALGTMMEMEYARQLGLYIILYCPSKCKNIFADKTVDKEVHSEFELRCLLRSITYEQ